MHFNQLNLLLTLLGLLGSLHALPIPQSRRLVLRQETAGTNDTATPTNTTQTVPPSNSTSTNSTSPSTPTPPSSTPPTGSSGTGKSVFAHFMVGNAYPYTANDWTTDIGLAQAAGIDAFALNLGSDSWETTQVDNAYVYPPISRFDLTYVRLVIQQRLGRASRCFCPWI